MNVAAFLPFLHLPSWRNLRTLSSLVDLALMQYGTSLPSKLLQWRLCELSLRLSRVSVVSRIMACEWTKVAAGCSSRLPLVCIVALIITTLRFFRCLGLRFGPRYLSYRRSPELNWPPMGMFACWLLYGSADSLLWALVEAVVPSRKLDASGSLSEDNVFYARNVV